MPNTTVSLVLGALRPLDLAALEALVRAHPSARLLAAETDLTNVIAACRQQRPGALLLDLAYPDGAAFAAVSFVLSNRLAHAAAVLDNDMVLARALKAHHIPRCCYCTRYQSFDEIHRAIQLAIPSNDANHRIAMLPAAPGLHDEHPLAAHDPHGILRLSFRERQVMCHLASGLSIPETAAALGLARSTVENHKSRVMKKLNLHRVVDLVRLGVASGFIVEQPVRLPRMRRETSHGESALRSTRNRKTSRLS